MFKNSELRINFAVIIMKFTLLCITLIIDSILLKLLIEYSRNKRASRSDRALALAQCDGDALNVAFANEFFGARNRSTLIRLHRCDFAGHRAI